MECKHQDPPVAVILTEDTLDSDKHVLFGPGHHGAVPISGHGAVPQVDMESVVVSCF